MKIYIVYEEYKGVIHVLHSTDEYGQIDYSESAANTLRDEWDRLHGHIGAKYYIKEVEL